MLRPGHLADGTRASARNETCRATTGIYIRAGPHVRVVGRCWNLSHDGSGVLLQVLASSPEQCRAVGSARQCSHELSFMTTHDNLQVLEGVRALPSSRIPVTSPEDKNRSFTTARNYNRSLATARQEHPQSGTF